MLHVIIALFVAQPIKCPADIVFVMDESGSIGSTNYNLMKSFVSQLVSRMDIDSGNTRVALVTFGTNVRSHFNFTTYTTVASVQAAVSQLSYSGGGTNTHSALAYVRSSLLTSAAGDRSDVPNVVVVLTDGHSSSPSSTLVSVSQSCSLPNVSYTYSFESKSIPVFFAIFSLVVNQRH